MTVYFDVYHARVSLISIIGIFEGALENFNKRLVEAQKIPQSNVSYKGRLEWAFDIASRSKYGNSDMQDRISDICMDVDNARRIRNLWMHNNGLFNERYGIDAIQVKGCRPLINPDFMKFKRDRRKRVPIILGIDEFRSIYKSHVELLHHLHDTIQREHFAQKRSYGYKELKKPIVWHRLLIGK